MVFLFEKIRDAYNKELAAIPKSAREKELRSFSIRFTYDTQRIEGSKLTLRETVGLLEEGTTPEGRPVSDLAEALAHQKVFFEMLSYKKDRNLQTVLYWHKKISEGSKPEIAGQIRKHQVIIAGSRFVPPSPVELFPLLRDFSDGTKGPKAI